MTYRSVSATVSLESPVELATNAKISATVSPKKDVEIAIAVQRVPLLFSAMPTDSVLAGNVGRDFISQSEGFHLSPVQHCPDPPRLTLSFY